MLQIQNTKLRVQAHKDADCYRLVFQCLDQDQAWRTVLATGAIAPRTIWEQSAEPICESPALEWQPDIDHQKLEKVEGFLSEGAISGEEEKRQLVLSGYAGCHTVREEIEIAGLDHVHVTVNDHLAAPVGSTHLGRLMDHFYFVPDGRFKRAVEPLEFAWLPALHKQGDHICADHFFRAPAVIVQGEGFFAALVPDLDLFAQHRSIAHALDLRVTETRIEAPRLSYGLCPSNVDGHVYFRHDENDVELVRSTDLTYGFDLFFGQAKTPLEVVQHIASYLWETYGHATFQDVRPQVLPFEVYGRRYTYVHELPSSIRSVTIDGKPCTGINNRHRRGANFHAWENDLHVAYGIQHYGSKWNDDGLREIADGILQLCLSAPRKNGAFPCIYNFDESGFEGSLFWTARAADPYRGYDSAAMSVTAWWQLAWYEDFDPAPELLDKLVEYGHFLTEVQTSSGAIPTYFFADLTPAKPLLESATSAISGAVLAKIAMLTGDAGLQDAATSAGHFIIKTILPELMFNDFETFYSCSPKPLHAIDYWSGIRPHNNLSIQWTCDQFLALYHLTGEEHWLHHGEFALNILSLYQQVWNPSHLSGYLFGGFGVMNTDGEWSDGRQARFVSTYVDYYLATGKLEYLERAIAACRASFALMDIQEHHVNGINDVRIEEKAGQGYAPENIHHRGAESGYAWTGMNWSSGGALAASAYLERRLGTVWVDAVAKTAIPVDGVTATIEIWNGSEIGLTVRSALASLHHPFTEARQCTIRFGKLSRSDYRVTINHAEPQIWTHEQLEKGITIQL